MGTRSGVIFNSILDRDTDLAVRLNPDVPAELEEIISKCLEKDRESSLPACLRDSGPTCNG